jgi:hypothetical protein
MLERLEALAEFRERALQLLDFVEHLQDEGRHGLASSRADSNRFRAGQDVWRIR